MVTMLRALTGTVILAVLAVACEPAVAWGFGKNKEVTCYHTEAGDPVVLTREVCKLHYQGKATEQANLTYRTVISQLDLQEPDCTDLSDGWCAYQKEIYNQKVLQLAAQPNQAMQLQNNREERAHEAKLDRRRVVLEAATLGLAAYNSIYQPAARGIGGVSFRGDTIRGNAGGGAGGDGAGGGSEVGKQGDTYQMYVERGANVQVGAAGAAVSGQENYRDAAQNRPYVDEGGTLAPASNRTSSRTIGLN